MAAQTELYRKNALLSGANGVLNRVAEDRVLLDSFRQPHKRFGTTYSGAWD
jgi:hypothetical protein